MYIFSTIATCVCTGGTVGAAIATLAGKSVATCAAIGKLAGASVGITAAIAELANKFPYHTGQAAAKVRTAKNYGGHCTWI